MTRENKITLSLAGIICAGIAASAIRPPSGSMWFVEIVWCAGYFLLLAATFPSFRFSNASYAIAALWCVLQAVGARYTFELVPFDFFQNFLGSERNHFDRVAHFAVGLNAFLACELFLRKKWANGARAAAFFGFLAVVALAGIWEIIEWIYAEWDGGDAGAAFLGSQGDVWDAQKDILCDTLGALAASAAFLLSRRRSREKKRTAE